MELDELLKIHNFYNYLKHTLKVKSVYHILPKSYQPVSPDLGTGFFEIKVYASEPDATEDLLLDLTITEFLKFKGLSVFQYIWLHAPKAKYFTVKYRLGVYPRDSFILVEATLRVTSRHKAIDVIYASRYDDKVVADHRVIESYIIGKQCSYIKKSIKIIDTPKRIPQSKALDAEFEEFLKVLV